jgi:hypothetical protein
MVHPHVERLIRSLVPEAALTVDQWKKALASWDEYFAANRVELVAQVMVWKAVMRRRAQLGSVLLTAPTGPIEREVASRTVKRILNGD